MKYKIIFILILFFTFARFTITDSIPNGTQSENYIESHNNYAARLDVSGLAIGENQTRKGVTFAKYIEPGKNKNSLDIKLILKMPPKPAKLDIVLAMDTSGSMVQHYNSANGQNHQGESDIEFASREVIRLLKDYSDARVSIVAWDDESDDYETKFYNIDNESQLIEDELIHLHKQCRETDFTIYSIGIKRAIEKLDEEEPPDPFNTSRIIIFVTGLSEFRAEPENVQKGQTLKELLYNASANRTYGNKGIFRGYQIYPIQIGIEKKYKMQFDNLSMISRMTSVDRNISRIYSINNTRELANEIDEILVNEASKPIAYDVEVTDTLYPYLEYDGYESSLVNEKTGNERSINLIGLEPLKNSFIGSTPLAWRIGNMNGDDKWSATIHTRLVLNLPVEISDNRTLSGFEISDSLPISQIKYKWMTGIEEIINLPEPVIQVYSGR